MITRYGFSELSLLSAESDKQSVFLGKDFLSINKEESIDWEDIKHIAKSLIGEFYSEGKDFIYDENIESKDKKEF